MITLGLAIFSDLLSWLSSLFSTPAGKMFLDYFPNLLVALGLGALLGYERRMKHKIAGVRTHMVMSASACIITLCGVYMAQTNHAIDPTRLAAQILSGIGFVGAGVILRQGWKTSGLTTSATILFASGIGIAAGFGYFMMATVATVSLFSAMLLTYKFFPSHEMGGHTLKVICPLDKFEEVKRKFGANSRVDSLQKLGGNIEFRLHTTLTSPQLDKLLTEMVKDPDVLTVDVIDDPS